MYSVLLIIEPYSWSSRALLSGNPRSIALGFHPISRWGSGRLSSASHLKALAGAFAQAQRETGKQVMLVMRPAPDLNGMEEFLAAQEALVKAGLPVLHSLGSAARAMAKVEKWQRGCFEE